MQAAVQRLLADVRNSAWAKGALAARLMPALKIMPMMVGIPLRSKPRVAPSLWIQARYVMKGVGFGF